MTFPGDPRSLSGQKLSNFAEMPGTNPDKIGPKCPKSQIDDPDRNARKCYSMSINPDKYQHGLGAENFGTHSKPQPRLY